MISKPRKHILKPPLKWLISILILLLVLVHASDYFIKMSEANFKEFLRVNKVYISESIKSNKQDLFIVKSKEINRSKPTLLFVHGAPGSWDAFKYFFEDIDLSRDFNLIAYDRFGYGRSADNNSLTSLKTQSQSVEDIISHYNLDSVFLISHSYGGPIASIVAAKNKTVKGLALISPAISPNDEKTFWFAWFAIWKSTRWMLPRSLQVAGVEKKNHAEEIRKVQSDFKSISCKVLLMQSTDDILAPGIGNINFVMENFSSANLSKKIYTDKGHIFLFTEPDIVKEELMVWFNN